MRTTIIALAALLTASGAVAAGGGSPAAPGGAHVLSRDRLYDAAFLGTGEAVAVGYPGIILKTADGGGTFTRVSTDTVDALYAVSFADKARGWVAGRSGLILATADGGATWRRQETGTPEHLFDVAFRDATHGIAVGSFGTIARTADGGARWTVETFERMANASINAVTFSPAGRAFIVGEYPAWEAQLEEGVDTAKLGNMFYSDDAGATWTKQDCGATNALNDIIFIDATHGWAAGSKGTLLRTDDGGAGWTRVPTPVKTHLFKLARRGGETWVAGADGTLLRVAQAGPQVVDIGPAPWLHALAFASDGPAGLLLGGRGLMRHTTDGGATWKTAGGGAR